jgi:hypothetical protein
MRLKSTRQTMALNERNMRVIARAIVEERVNLLTGPAAEAFLNWDGVTQLGPRGDAIVSLTVDDLNELLDLAADEQAAFNRHASGS